MMRTNLCCPVIKVFAECHPAFYKFPGTCTEHVCVVATLLFKKSRHKNDVLLSFRWMSLRDYQMLFCMKGNQPDSPGIIISLQLMRQRIMWRSVWQVMSVCWSGGWWNGFSSAFLSGLIFKLLRPDDDDFMKLIEASEFIFYSSSFVDLSHRCLNSENPHLPLTHQTDGGIMGICGTSLKRSPSHQLAFAL